MMLKQFIKESFRYYLLERTSEPAPFKRIRNTMQSVSYEFYAGDRYEFNITHKSEGFGPGTYEAVFMKDGQSSSADRGSNTGVGTFVILATCKAIMDIECKEKKIRTYHMEGALDKESEKMKKRGDNDDDTQRARIYEMFFVDKYSSTAVSRDGRFITVDMTQVYPEVFTDVEGGSSVNGVMSLLMKVANENGNKNLIYGGFEGNENSFSVITDELVNTNYGGLDLEIMVNNLKHEYEVQYNKFDIGEADSQTFTSLRELLQYIQTKLLK